MMTKPLIFLFTSLVILQTLCLSAADYYVAPDGNDNWSGKIATPNPQRTDGPFANLERAREGRACPQTDLGRGRTTGSLWRCWPGPMSCRGPSSSPGEDSGEDGAPTVYRARAGADVRLLGGRRVEGFVHLTRVPC